jgi:hypothetical protein
MTEGLHLRIPCIGVVSIGIDQGLFACSGRPLTPPRRKTIVSLGIFIKDKNLRLEIGGIGADYLHNNARHFNVRTRWCRVSPRDDAPSAELKRAALRAIWARRGRKVALS